MLVVGKLAETSPLVDVETDFEFSSKVLPRCEFGPVSANVLELAAGTIEATEDCTMKVDGDTVLGSGAIKLGELVLVSGRYDAVIEEVVGAELRMVLLVVNGDKVLLKKPPMDVSRFGGSEGWSGTVVIGVLTTGA